MTTLRQYVEEKLKSKCHHCKEQIEPDDEIALDYDGIMYHKECKAKYEKARQHGTRPARPRLYQPRCSSCGIYKIYCNGRFAVQHCPLEPKD